MRRFLPWREQRSSGYRSISTRLDPTALTLTASCAALQRPDHGRRRAIYYCFSLRLALVGTFPVSKKKSSIARASSTETDSGASAMLAWIAAASRSCLFLRRSLIRSSARFPASAIIFRRRATSSSETAIHSSRWSFCTSIKNVPTLVGENAIALNEWRKEEKQFLAIRS